MQFTELQFLIGLLPAAVALCLLTRGNQYVMLLVGLLYLYAASPAGAAVLMGLAAADLLLAWCCGRQKQPAAKALLCAGIVLNIGVLCVYRVLSAQQGEDLIVPLGLSYFVFKGVSLITDAYRGKYQPFRLREAALYLFFFPQITAGPLSRISALQKAPDLSYVRLCRGIGRFMIGFSKKVLLADILAKVILRADAAAETGTALAWLRAVCYSLELYYDFSGYSDMAIGLTELMGYDCPENFDYPYMMASVSEFWRRWHITLGSWFRDYVYIPMGGSRVGTMRLICNLFVVWLLTGIWHGTGLNFLIWAGGYFLLIVFEKLSGLPKKLHSKIGRAIYRIAVLLFINFQWVWFSAENAGAAWSQIRSMLLPDGTGAAYAGGLLLRYAPCIIPALLCCFPLGRKLRQLSEKQAAAGAVCRWGTVIVTCALFLWAVSFLMMDVSQPFRYANF